MPHAHIIANERAKHQYSWGSAFGEGLRRHGWSVTMEEGPVSCDLLVLWGTRKRYAIEAQKRAGGEVCILERGYVGDRFEWTSVSFGGGLNNRGVFRGPFHDSSRWVRHFARLMAPWRRRDGYALIVGQVPGDMSLAGTDLAPWYEAMAHTLREHGYDTRFRPHPVAVERWQCRPVPGASTIEGTLREALDGASIVVTWNSNTATEAVLAGVPTITMDRGAMAWPVTGHSLSVPAPTPDRTAWAHALAWKQWRREEMTSGDCWAAIGADQCATAA